MQLTIYVSDVNDTQYLKKVNLHRIFRKRHDKFCDYGFYNN